MQRSLTWDGPGPASVLLFVAAVMIAEAATVRERVYLHIASGLAGLGVLAGVVALTAQLVS